MTRLAVGVVVGLLTIAGGVRAMQAPAVPPLQLFFEAASTDEALASKALEALASQWRDSYTPMIIDLARLMRPAGRPRADAFDMGAGPTGGAGEADGEFSTGAGRGAGDFPAAGRRVLPESLARARLVRFLERQTGQRFDEALHGWRMWMWTLPYEPHPEYAAFKAHVYSQIDPRMRAFFPAGVKAEIRLDEIDTGGVGVNGIPPLYNPAVVAAGEARYLRDNHIVFGIAVNGEARAYPRRILGWHEMAIDRVGGVDLTVVYCTLCGTVIPYESRLGAQHYIFGTSGLLYRSNKLMFDQQTFSLWSSIDGRPVVGPLAGSGLQLVSHPVVTTTWGEWKALHPATTVLSIETGFDRDYREGAAYRDYFNSDRLMFSVPGDDRRLKNKDEVLTMRIRPAAGGEAQAVAIEAEFLKRQPVYHFEVQGRRLVAVTTRQGANRVYLLGGHEVAFPSKAHDGRTIADSAGRRWQVTEEALIAADDPSARLPRVPAQRAFWFGWHAQYPDTLLMQR
ncbi:MAG: DUF3179 domain-containing protein [Vicinamibacterales bacterium]|nr:DUF3179 domain-containing protein [Vicinamibacterales bacterium]